MADGAWGALLEAEAAYLHPETGAVDADAMRESLSKQVMSRAIPPRISRAAEVVAEQPGRRFWTVVDQAAAEIQRAWKRRERRKKGVQHGRVHMSTFGSVARTLSDVEGVAARGHAAAHGGAADHDGAHWVEADGRRGLHEDKAFHGGLGVSVEEKAPHEHGHFAVHTGAGATFGEAYGGAHDPYAAQPHGHHEHVGFGGGAARFADDSSEHRQHQPAARRPRDTDSGLHLLTAESWGAAENRGRRIQVTRRAELLGRVPLFAKCSTSERRKLAALAEEVRLADGASVCHKGERGAMLVVEHGTCRVARGRADPSLHGRGQTFGQLGLLIGLPNAHGSEAVGSVSCLALRGAAVRGLLSTLWGGSEELRQRQQVLRSLKPFRGLSNADILLLATIGETVLYPEIGTEILREGRIGRHMYILLSGRPTVHRQGMEGAESLEPGRAFGEEAMANPPSWRTASVRTTTKDTVCLRFGFGDLCKVLAGEQRALETLARAGGAQGLRDTLRASPDVEQLLQRFWGVAVVESSRIAGRSAAASLAPAHARWKMLRREIGGGSVSREGYAAVGLLIAKVLTPDFDLDTATEAVQRDWAEDVTAFSSDGLVNVGLEEAKYAATIFLASGLRFS